MPPPDYGRRQRHQPFREPSHRPTKPRVEPLVERSPVVADGVRATQQPRCSCAAHRVPFVSDRGVRPNDHTARVPGAQREIGVLAAGETQPLVEAVAQLVEDASA